MTGVENTNVYPTNHDQRVTTRKYSSSGTLLASTTYNGGVYTGPCNTEAGYCIATDGTYVWVAASTYNSTANAYLDFTLLKYNCSNLSMVTNYPKTSNDLDYCGSGGFSIRATCLSLVSYGGNTECFIGGNASDGQSFLYAVKDNRSGTGFSWTWNYAGTAQASGDLYEHCINDIKISSDDTKVYLSGFVANLSSTNGKRDIFTTVLDASNGTDKTGWPATYDGSVHHNDVPNALEVDGSGNIYVCGYTTASSGGSNKNAILLKYNSTGSLQSGYPVTYAGSGGSDDAWTDIAVIGTSTSSPALFVGGYAAQTGTGSDYSLAAYTSSGVLASGWTANPVFYDGTRSAADIGQAIEYSSSSGRVYITGLADEATTGSNYNLTTLGYSSTNGSKVWGKASYDYASDVVVGADEPHYKYSMKVLWNSLYCVDDIYITGDAYISTSYDYLTLKYSCGTCTSCQRVMGEDPTNSADLMSSIEVRPNPAHNNIFISAPSEIRSVIVVDMIGKTILAHSPENTSDVSLDVSALPAGVYFVKVVSADANKLIKVVKQ